MRKKRTKIFGAILLILCMLLQIIPTTLVDAGNSENLMSQATLSSTTSVWWNSTPTLVDGDKTWDPNNYGEAVAYDGEGGMAYYQADFAEEVSLGQVRLYMYYAGSDGAAKDIAVDVKLSNGTWVRVAEKHDITYKGTHEEGDLTLTYQGSSPAMYLAMNFETIDCVAFRVSANKTRGNALSFRLVEIEAYSAYPEDQSVTGIVKDANDSYNIPYIFSNVNLMIGAALSSTTSLWWNSTPALVDGNTIWDSSNFGEAVAYDGEGGVAYYQADFAEELSIGQVRLYMYYGGNDGAAKDIAVDVKLSNGTWVRVAEKHNIIYKGTHEGGDLTLTYQGSSPAMYLAMNFETVDCVAFRVSAKNNRDGVGSFRLVEIEAYNTYPAGQSLTGTVKDTNDAYNIPYIFSNKNMMIGAALSSTTSLWWNSTPALVDGNTIWDPDNYGEAVAYDGEGGVAYYQADFAEAISLGQVRLYMYYGGTDGSAKDIAVDVKLSNGTWVRVAEKHDITYSGTHEGGDLTLTYQGSSPAMYLAMNFETVDCVAFRVSAKNNRNGVGSFRLVEIEAYNTYPSGQSVTGTAQDENDNYNIPYIKDGMNLMTYATLSSTSVASGTPDSLVNGKKTWRNYTNNSANAVEAGVAVAYDGTGSVAYYQADFAEEITLGQVRLYVYVENIDRPGDIAIDVKLSDGIWKRVAEKHNVNYAENGGDLVLEGSTDNVVCYYVPMNFDSIDCVAFRVSAKGNRTGASSFRLVEIEAYEVYPTDQSVTGIVPDENTSYNIPNIYSEINLMKNTTLISSKVLGGTLDSLVNGTKTWWNNTDIPANDVESGVAVAYDRAGGVAYYQAEFSQETPLGQVRLFVYVEAIDRPGDIVVDVRLADGTWKRVAERHDIDYTENTGDMTLTWTPAASYYLEMNFDSVNCVAFRVSAKGNRTNAAGFRLVEIEAYNAYPSDSSVTGISKDQNDSYNIPKLNTQETMPQSLREITFSDFGLANGTYTTEVSGKYSGTSLNGVVLTGGIKATGGSSLFVGGLENWKGIWLLFDGNKIKLSNGAGATTEFPDMNLYQQIAGVPLTGTELLLQLSFEYVNHDNGSIANDLKLGIWFSGKLYNNEFIYIDNYADTMGCNLHIPATEGATTIQSRMELLEKYTFADTWMQNTTIGIPSTNASSYDVYFWNETNGFIYNKKPLNGVSGTECYMMYTVDAFDGTKYQHGLVGTSLPKDDYPFRIGSGIAYLGNYTENTNALFEEGYTYFVKFVVTDNDYEYTVIRTNGVKKEIVVSQVREKSDEKEVDLKYFGLYLQGSAVNAKISNVSFWDKNGTDLKLASNSSQAVVYDAGYRHETNESYNLANGKYVIVGTGPITVTGANAESGKKYKPGDTLNTPGKYTIVSNYGLYTKNVVLYKDDKKSTEISTQENVMPIAGFFGPYRTEDKHGTYRDLVTDDIFAKIREMGVNLIVSSPESWMEKGSSDVITKSLLLAEKYNIGVYVNDDSLLSKNELVSALGLYSNFSSFKGIHLIDEPTTQSYHAPGTSGNSLSYYANAAKQLNQYTNLNAYINLLPIVPDWATSAGVNESTYYNTYLNEYIDATNPRHLSYDYYVFEGNTSRYFNNLSLVRSKSLDKNIPFWGFVQAGSNFNDEKKDLYTVNRNNTPTQGEFLWNVNTTLAYGAKGIEYFTLVQPWYYAYESSADKYDYDRNGLIAADGSLTAWGGYAKQANAQIAAIDEVLMNATSKAVLAYGYSLQRSTGITQTSYGKLGSINSSSSTGALVGAFEYRNKDVFYVVNNDTSRSQTITLNFTENTTYRIIQNATTTYGQGQTLIMSDIPAGEAVLVVLGEKVQKTSADLNATLTGIYMLPGKGVLSIRNQNGTLIEHTSTDIPGIYQYSYEMLEESYCGEIVIYRGGDVNGDSKTDIRDLVRLKKGIDPSDEVVWYSAMQDTTGDALRKYLISN